MNPQYGAGPPAGYGQPAGAAPVYSQPQVQQHVTVAPIVMTNYRGVLRGVPGRVTCQFCQTEVITATSKKTGLITWAACGGIAIFGYDNDF